MTREIRNVTAISLITVSMWVIYTLYNTYYAETVPQVYHELAKPLNADINIDLLRSLEYKNHYIDYNQHTNISKIAEPLKQLDPVEPEHIIQTP